MFLFYNYIKRENLGKPEEAQGKTYGAYYDTNPGHILGLDQTCA